MCVLSDDGKNDERRKSKESTNKVETQSTGEETGGSRRRSNTRNTQNDKQEEHEKQDDEGMDDTITSGDDPGVSSPLIAQDSAGPTEEDKDEDNDDKQEEEGEPVSVWWYIGLILLVGISIGFSNTSSNFEEIFSSTDSIRPLNKFMNDTSFPSLMPSLNQSNQSSLSPSPSLSEFPVFLPSIAPSLLPSASASNLRTPTPTLPMTVQPSSTSHLPSMLLLPSASASNPPTVAPTLAMLAPIQLTGEPSANSTSAMSSQPTSPPSSRNSTSAMSSQPTSPPSSSPTNEDNATSLEMNILRGHTGVVHCIVYSPDGKHIASGSSDNTTKIWNATSDGPPVRTLEGHTDWVVTAAYSPDGKYIATGSWDTTIKIWNATEGESAIRTLDHHNGTITTVAYSSDGLFIASASQDGVIYVWDSTEGEEPIFMLEGDLVTFYMDGSHIANCSETGNHIDLWEFEDGPNYMRSIEYEEDDQISSLAISPNGYLASGLFDNDTIKISCWGLDVQNVSNISLYGHMDKIISMAFGRLPNSDTTFLASASLDDTIRLWDLDNETNIRTINATGVTSVTYSANATHIAWGSDDNTIKVLKI